MAKRQFGVLGLGRFGFSVAKCLAESGHEVIAIDQDMEIVESIAKYVTKAIQADVADEDDLKAAGIKNCDTVVISTGGHLESSILATILVKQLGVNYVLAKAPSETHKSILEKIGADKVVYPEKDMGARIANTLIYGDTFDFIELSNEYGIAEIYPLKQWIGKSLIESNIRGEYGLNVVAIKNKKTGEMSVTQAPSQIITEDDILIAFGEYVQMEKLVRAEKNEK